jgi:DNA-binding winged helix-turn-helix (wHTH) protein/uncharacterized protein YhfF
MHTVVPKMLGFENYTLDLMRCALLRGEEEISLRPKAFDVLRYLAERAGRLVTKEELIEAMWPDIFVTDDSLVQCIAEIREALSDDARKIIRTVPRRGYLFAATAGTASAAPAADASASFAQLRWQRRESAFPSAEDRYYSPMFIGLSPAVGDAGAAAILDGIKTATSSAPWEFPDGRLPFVGALSVLLDGQRRPRAIVETECVAITPFASVGEEFAWAFGEGDRTLDWWRKNIREFYRECAAGRGEEFSDNTPIICEWFTVVRRL